MLLLGVLYSIINLMYFIGLRKSIMVFELGNKFMALKDVERLLNYKEIGIEFRQNYVNFCSFKELEL